MSLDVTLALVACALVIEAAFGYPRALARRIGHPVEWVGVLIARLDAALNRPTLPEAARRLNGVFAVGLVLAAAGGAAWALQSLGLALLPFAAAVLLLALAASTLIAQRSLHDHVAAVADGLEQEGLAGGRAAVAHIVGRDPDWLDEAGVARAAIESLAENFSDGVAAPAFWLALLGLPGIAAYKAVNTADSMIGHLNQRHRAFGRAAARLDDLVNLPGSRLSALWLVMAARILRADAPGALRAVRRDARRHRSPNAGWPEAAMAGALGLRLAGPRVYGGTLTDDAHMGDGRAEATAADIHRALALYRCACAVQVASAAGLAGLIALW